MLLARIIILLGKHPIGQFILGVVFAYVGIGVFEMLFSPHHPDSLIVGWIMGVFCSLIGLLFLIVSFLHGIRWLRAKSAPAVTQQSPLQRPQS
ncbi:MAG TPA: hypothetical protein VH593_21930 [Ktedonobacteraceae bacterium]